MIGEFEYAGLVHSTGETFSVANIQVIRVHAGLISQTRDHHDHARLTEAIHRTT